MTEYTLGESVYLHRIRQNIELLREFLNENQPVENADAASWFEYLGKIRAIQGNTSNDYSFIACLLAKQYLATRFDIGNYDAALKPQGAPGLDVELMTAHGQRIVAEVKTTVPYSAAKNDLGSQQKSSFQKDFDKLNRAIADYKFFFVTDPKTYEVVQQRYIHLIPDTELVLLTSNS